MTRDEETRRAAMKVEEAALLPAMSRGGYGKAAYRSVMREADRMRSLRVTDTAGDVGNKVQAENPAVRRRNRPALYHALGK